MQFPGIVVISEGVLGVLLVGTWYRESQRNGVHHSVRQRASLVSLVLPTIALGVGLVLVTGAHFRLLEALDRVSPGGKWVVLGARVWIWSLLSTGVLSLCGLVLAAIGEGSPRALGAVWSSLVLCTFLLNLVLAVNFFH